MIRAFRGLLRLCVPLAVRWRIRAARRSLHDRLSGAHFAAAHASLEGFSDRVCAYTLPVSCYPGQKERFAGKRHNLMLSLAAIDGLVVEPGATFSFWNAVRRPTGAAGYAAAAAIKAGRLTEDVGGSVCLASTLLYNAGLLAGMAVVERYCHSVDSYGDARYFELGRDASVEYAYRDLRLRNDLPVPIVLRARLEGTTAVAEVWTARHVDLEVEIAVSPATYTEAPVVRHRDRALDSRTVVDDPGSAGIEVRTWRTVRLDGIARTDDLGFSRHEARPRRERYAVPESVAPERDAGAPLS